MPLNSKRKGADGEIDWRNFLKERGFEARRGQQYCGANGDADVICEELSHIHWEVKRTEYLSFRKALEQAKSDADEGKTPIVVQRGNRQDWVAIIEADKLLGMISELKEFKANKRELLYDRFLVDVENGTIPLTAKVMADYVNIKHVRKMLNKQKEAKNV
jgi:hypothetical protein